jgi:predicted enzyme related to lactoylglutathione lyase
MHEKINYVEFPSSNLTATKKFFKLVFAWEFQDFGEEYTAFSNQGLDGGFYQSELKANAKDGSALIVFYSDSLETTRQKIIQAGGTITQDIFTFPGGRRFHFTEPCGNELAVWSDLL